jgi:hypothetical protein
MLPNLVDFQGPINNSWETAFPSMREVLLYISAYATQSGPSLVMS